MKLLIIGSEGFIGRHCRNFFSAQGSEIYSADVVVSDTSRYTQLLQKGTSFDTLFRDVQYDLCINASGSAHVGFSFDKPDVDFELNVLNVHKLLVAIRTFNPECRFINFSSAAVYGNPQSLPIAEDHGHNPLSPYGFHKLQSEYLLAQYHRFFGIATCSLRIFSAYGPGLRKQLFWDLYRKSLHTREVTLFGTGDETRDFIYIDDLMQAIRCVINNGPFEGECYNVASGRETKISEAVELFYTYLRPGIKVHFSGEQKLGDPDNWVADISRLGQLGFRPAHTLAEGLEQTADWLLHTEA